MYNVLLVPVGIYEGCAFVVNQCGGFTVIQLVCSFLPYSPAVNRSCDYLDQDSDHRVLLNLPLRVVLFNKGKKKHVLESLQRKHNFVVLTP